MIVSVLILLVAGVMLAVSWVNNKVNYTPGRGVVMGHEQVCTVTGESVSEATGCREAQIRAGAKKLRFHEALRVRYRSPVDGREMSAFLVPPAGKRNRRAAEYERGEEIMILIHDDHPERIKADAL